ncbi:hypothetical protein DVH05_026405 [Phytophthora capsici]|nr:hypothetical protein DVH05_026405 [Phytophthora capsici]
MDGSFDGLDAPKHERVAKALEQVNGFRYRYHPAQQDGKKMLRFDSDDDSDLNEGEGDGDEGSSDETQRQQRRKPTKEKHLNDGLEPPMLTVDDHIENLLHKTRTLAMLKIANNTAGTIPSDSEDDDDDSDEAGDVVSDKLSTTSLSTISSPKHGASSRMLSRLGSTSTMDGRRSSFLGTAAMKLARTLSAFLCLPRAISYVDLEAITEKLLESTPNDHFDDDEYADLIDCHVDSARDDEAHTGADEEEPIWKRRNSVRKMSYLRLGHAHEPDTYLLGNQRPIRPLTLSEDPTDLEMHQRHIFMEANRFGGVSSRNMFLASSKHLLSKDDCKGSMYLGMSASGRLLGSTTNGSSMSLNLGRQTSTSTVLSNTSSSGIAAETVTNPFNEEEYVMWRTQVKEDYLAWLNAKVEAQKRRKSRVKKVDPNKKPRWLLLYEASKHPTQKYQPDVKV